MALFPDPFGTLLGLQSALDGFRRSDWLQSGPSASGSYPPLNVFRKGDDFALVAELPGVSSSDLDIQVKGRTVRLSGSKSAKYPEKLRYLILAIRHSSMYVANLNHQRDQHSHYNSRDLGDTFRALAK